MRAPVPVQGKPAAVRHDNRGVFTHLPQNFQAGRYHSLVVERSSFPADLEITAQTPDNLIMGLRHKTYKIEGVQFHPESILTDAGKKLLENFLRL